MLGVLYEVASDESAVPPLAVAYQSILFPEPGVADIVTVPVEHLELFPAVGTAGNGLIVRFNKGTVPVAI